MNAPRHRTIATAATVAGRDQAIDCYAFRSQVGEHLMIVPHTQIYDVPANAGFQRLDPTAQAKLVAALTQPMITDMPLESVVLPSVQSLSLNVSASCNLSCHYCYAGQGSFGGKQQRAMQWDVCRTSIDRLLQQADPAAPVTIGFIGGEPFVNRKLIHQAVQYSSAVAAQRKLDLRYSVTTNGTLLRDADHDLIRKHRFAVTISIDGDRTVQNRNRPLTTGRRDSFQELVEHCQPLISRPGQAKLCARATVNAMSMDLLASFQSILALGFTDIGFSPLRGQHAMTLGDTDWPTFTSAMIDLARHELVRAMNGDAIRLSNLATALKQLHVGASSPYPCGAGGGYFSVADNGDWYACHRAVGNPQYKLGDVQTLNAASRVLFLSTHHVHAQDDCNTCWARYLCAGGCHHEKQSRTHASCDFVRNWLTFCLQSYCELRATRPDYFQPQH